MIGKEVHDIIKKALKMSDEMKRFSDSRSSEKEADRAAINQAEDKESEVKDPYLGL